MPRPSVAISRAASENFGAGDWQLVYRSTEEPAIGDAATVVIDREPANDWIRIRYGDSTTFILNGTGTEVRASWIPPSTPSDVATYLLGPVIGLLLYLRGQTCLHASAVAHRGKALVFVGAAEAGKSTLAAAFARMGHRVLTDDILLLDRSSRTIVAQPGIPRIGLWPQSVKHLWGSEDALPRQVSTWDKRRVDLVDHGLFQDSALPVGAIYVLDERAPNARLRIEALAGTEAILALIANKYVTRISEREQNKRDFVLLSELAASVPIRRITRSDALTELNTTCDAILADYASLALTPA